MSTIQFVPVRFIATGATGSVPENNLAYFLDRGYEVITDEEVGQSPFPYVRLIRSGSSDLSGIVTVEELLEALGDGIEGVSDAAVEALRSALLGGAPVLLDTLNELAQALDDDPHFATTITGLLAAKVDKPTAQGIALVQALIFGGN